MADSCFQVINISPIDVLPMTLYTSHMYICTYVSTSRPGARNWARSCCCKKRKHSELTFYRLVDSVLALLAGCRTNNDKPKKSGSNHHAILVGQNHYFPLQKWWKSFFGTIVFFFLFCTSLDPSGNVQTNVILPWHTPISPTELMIGDEKLEEYKWTQGKTQLHWCLF